MIILMCCFKKVNLSAILLVYKRIINKDCTVKNNNEVHLATLLQHFQDRYTPHTWITGHITQQWLFCAMKHELSLWGKHWQHVNIMCYVQPSSILVTNSEASVCHSIHAEHMCQQIAPRVSMVFCLFIWEFC